MHSVGQQQLQRRSNSTRMPLMYSTSLPPVPLLQAPPLISRHSNINMRHYQRGNGNRGNRGLSMTHRQQQQQQRTITGFRHHPYQIRPLLPPQRSYRPAHPFPHTLASLMGTPPGMSQSEYERIHSAQVQRDKEKLVRHGHVLAPSNTTQFLIQDHNHQTTPSIDQINNSSSSSSSKTEHQSSLKYDQMFAMNDADTENTQDIDIDSSFDDDFNDIYYQCRYERYAAFSRTALLNEVLSLCANVDRLQHEKSEVEKRLRDVQNHVYTITTQSQNEDDSQPRIDANESVVESVLSENEQKAIHI